MNTRMMDVRPDYEKVMSRHLFRIKPWLAVVIAVIVLCFVIGAAKYSIPRVVSWTLDCPTLTLNPYKQVVKVEEADGKILTAANPLFKKRVQEIRSSGHYDVNYTGRLDGRP